MLVANAGLPTVNNTVGIRRKRTPFDMAATVAYNLMRAQTARWSALHINQ